MKPAAFGSPMTDASAPTTSSSHLYFPCHLSALPEHRQHLHARTTHTPHQHAHGSATLHPACRAVPSSPSTQRHVPLGARGRGGAWRSIKGEARKLLPNEKGVRRAEGERQELHSHRPTNPILPLALRYSP
ncbi:hypothetical protein E2C01_035050 [Portunus trituberculatus]|uniref:Uncharacterized protein n=1 Tax=Portunus trituberculatus TaxID=210409 RepID=A0A5B7F8N2_PORTR|nr:hypothetical protein [Portunus trituberculatus]